MDNFVYYNNNPYGYTDEDCVTRAITLASGDDYDEVSRKLYLLGELMDCDKLNVDCYKFLIETVYGFPQVEFERGITIGEFMEQHPYGIYLIRMSGHITCLIDGQLWDLWDATDKEPTNIWFCGY